MLRSDTLFGKRDNNTPNPPLSTTNSSVLSGTNANGANSASNAFNKNALNSNQQAPSTNEVGSKLIVGPNIKLKGVEITDCDTLVVEGFVEATMDSRVIQIAKEGSFKGSAGIDIAEIHGEFDGDLTVRQKLVIYATGRVSGKIRYGHVVIEEGGQLSGDVQVGTGASLSPPKMAAVAKNG
ncbi:MAG: polymer-forming cytoskeletal protein [Oxalicibacterium faecigallinarum]|uniref:bactofilin family protein n=1 Tax=Oxalicibacterium faecigallinarum TaxID=573741 RepID=UPI00280832C2|nr:polymer-forming cytoskeletal protein [Oxalicibacterium faecigallinarum]MDQ7970758.1 polymer-forming cytoskeletal protein [Oxalicibacterium faecigallinarum]